MQIMVTFASGRTCSLVDADVGMHDPYDYQNTGAHWCLWIVMIVAGNLRSAWVGRELGCRLIRGATPPKRAVTPSL